VREKLQLRRKKLLSMVLHAYSHSTWEAEIWGCQVQDEAGLQRETLFQKQTNKQNQKNMPTPVIPATQEAELRRIAVQSQPGQMVQETLSWKTLHTHTYTHTHTHTHTHTNRAGRVAQSGGPEFKPQHWKKKKWRKLFRLTGGRGSVFLEPICWSCHFVISFTSMMWCGDNTVVRGGDCY
jgi:hypothetical protein